jgi:hypothetical protein
MAKPVFNYERAATVIAEAAFFGDQRAIERHDVSLRSLQRWRDRLDNDAKLAQFVALKKRALEKEWAADLAPSISASIDFIKRAAQAGNVTDPNMVHSITGGLKIMTDVAMATKILDERLSSKRGSMAQGDESMAPGRDTEGALD